VRILYVSHSALPTIGGVELYLQALLRNLAPRHEVAILLPAVAGSRFSRPSSVSAGKAEVTCLTVPGAAGIRAFRETYARGDNAQAARSALERFHPDVVHIHHLMNHSIELPELARTAGARVIVTLHDYWLECANGGQRWHPDLGLCERLDARRCAQCTVTLTAPALALRRLLPSLSNRFPTQRGGRQGGAGPQESPCWAGLGRSMGQGLRSVSRALGIGATRRIELRWREIRRAAAAADLFLSPSQFVRDEFIRFGIDGRQIRVLPHGLDLSRYAPRGPLPDRARRFAFIGSLVPHKGLDVLLRAFGALPPEAALSVYGDSGGDRRYLAALRRLAVHPGIRFCGPVANEEIPRILADTDCVVCPAVWWENHPTAVLEAFAAGVPVVATEVGGQQAMLAGGGGVAVQPGDIAGLHRSLQALMTQRGLLQRLATTIPPVPSETEHVTELERIYADLITRRPYSSRDSCQ
jgi:glycosyltransferase involved in cell wall biosynthesis